MPRKRKTRREHGSGSIFFDESRGSWVASLRVVVDGKKRRPLRLAESEADAKLKLRQLTAEYEDGAPVRDGTTVGGYIEGWLDAIRVESSTLRRYRSLVKGHVSTDRRFASIAMADIDPSAVLEYYGRAARAGASDSTMRKVHLLLHAAFEDARHMRRIMANPCDLPKKLKPKYVRPEIHPLSSAEEGWLIRTVRGGEWEAMILLALDAGPRQGEVFALEIDDLDVDACTVRIDKTLKDDEDGTLRVGPPKTKRSIRTLDVSRSTMNALIAHRDRLRAKGYDGPLLFPDRSGGYLRRQNFNRRSWARIMQTAEDKSGLVFGAWTTDKKGRPVYEPTFTFHDLRHTMATMLFADGVPLPDVSRRLGHEKVSTTAEFYAHVMPENVGTLGARFERRLADKDLGQTSRS